MIQNKHEKALPGKKADIADRDDSGQQTRPARRRRQRSGAGDPASEQIARSVMDRPGAREGNRAHNAASKPQRTRRKQNQPKKIDVFEPHQTKMLQKWFLDNIQRPYVKPADKELLARQTGLDGKQISGWFTNNRKRKYSKVLEAAKKKNKDFSYVRDVMRVKFDRNLDQSSSLSGQSQSSFSLNKQQRSDKWNARRSSRDGAEDLDDDDSAELNEAVSQKRRRSKSNARSNLIKSLPFLENDEVDALKKQRGPEKGNEEPMDIDRSEDTIQKSQIVEKSEVAAGLNSEVVEAKKARPIALQAAHLGATPCQVTEKFELPLPKTIISDQSQWSPLKFMASLGKTIDRHNETATRASLSGIPIDPRSYQSQLLQTLQGSQGTKIEYFTIRNQGEDERELLENEELEESQKQNDSQPGPLPQGPRGEESNELQEQQNEQQIVDKDINNNQNLDQKARQQRRTKDRSGRRDASQEADAAGIGRGLLGPRQNQAGSRHPSEGSGSGPSVAAPQTDARLRKRHEVEKLCQRTQFIPIVLMWCPNLLAGQHCGCGYRSLPSVPNIKGQVKAFLHMAKGHQRTQKCINDSSELEPRHRSKGDKATQMDKNMDDQQIDSGTQINKHNNLSILKEQTNPGAHNKVLRARLAQGGGSMLEHRRDGKERLGDQVKSAYDQENILKNEGQKQAGSDHVQTNFDFTANQDNDREPGHRVEIHYSKQKGPLVIATNQTNDILRTEAQDATGLAKQQEKLGQLRGHEQYQASPLLKLSPSFQEQHKIGPVHAKKEGSVLTQIYEQDFHLSNKLGHVTQVNDGGGLLKCQSAMRAVDNDQHSPFRQVQANYAAVDFDRRKFRTQQVRKEHGLGVQEDLLEDAKENYASLGPQIQSLFRRLLLRIVDEQMGSLDRRGGNAAPAFKQQDHQVAGERPDAAAAVISKSETSRHVLDDLDQFIGSKEREAQKQQEMNLLTRLILRQMAAEGGQQLIEAQFPGRPNPDRAALGWQLIHGLSLEQIQAPYSARQQFKTNQSPEPQTNAQILQDPANIPLQGEMPHDERSLLPRFEASKVAGQPKDQSEGHQVLSGGQRPANADRQCSDPQTESPPQKHSDLSVEGAFVNQSGPDNNSGQSAHSGQNAGGNIGSGNGGSSEQRQEAVHQQIKENHAGGNGDSNPSNLNPSHNPGSQTSSINREKKGAVAAHAPEHAPRAEPPEEEEVRSDEVCCERGLKHKNLSNDVNQPKKEQSPLNELRNSQEAPRHETTSGEGKDSQEKDNSGNKTVGGASAPQLVSNNALIGVRLDDSGAGASASINNKGAQPTLMMAMAAGYGCQLMAGPRSSLRTPTVPIIDRSHPKTNSDPTKEDREPQMNSMLNMVGASSRGAEAKDAEMITANYGPKRNGREGQVPRHEAAPDWRYVRESQQRVTENKVVKHIFDLQHGQHQHPKRSQDQQEAHVWVHSRTANPDRETGRRKNHRHFAAEERRRSMHRSRAAHDAQNVHGQSYMLPYPGYAAEGQAGMQPYGSYFADNSQGAQPPPAPPLDLDRLLAQYPSSIPGFMQAEQKPSQLPAQAMNNGGQQPAYPGPDSQMQYPRVDNMNIQGASGPIINQDGSRAAMPLNEPSSALGNSQEWPRGARHDKAVHAGVAVASYLREPASEGQAFLGSSPARISLPQPPGFAHRDPRVAPSNIAPPANMLTESQLGRPLIGSGGQVLNISYPLQQILIPIEVRPQQQAQPRATSPFLYNPQTMLANPAMSGMADVSGNLHPRQVNEKLGEVLSHALPNPSELHRPDFYTSLPSQPPSLYPDPSSLLPPTAHQQAQYMHPNQLRGHQLKMGQQQIEQMHLGHPYSTAAQDLAEVYNAQQEMYPLQGQQRMSQYGGMGQAGGSSIKLEQQPGPQFLNQEMQNIELQQVLEETQHVILKQLNQINSHSRHLFQQGLPANKEDGGNGRSDATDAKATPVRRKEGHQQRPQPQLQGPRQLPVNSPGARPDQQVHTTVQEREIHRNIAQLFELMGQQQSIYQTLVAQRLAPGNPGARPVGHAGALTAQLPNGPRMVDPMHSIQYMHQRRERAPSQALAEREALLQAQSSGEQPRLAVNRNPEELFGIPAPVEPSRHDSARVQRQSPGSGPSQFAPSKHPNSK